MSQDHYSAFREGTVSYELSPDDYVNILTNESYKELVKDFYERLNSYLVFIRRQYPARVGDIILRADTTKSISAKAKFGKIIISRGTIDYLSKIPQDQFLYVTGTSIKISGKTLSHLSGLWIIAHEYFHISRGHLGLLNTLYEKHGPGFEYDADNMATAALYRYVQSNIVPGFGRRAAKSVALFPVFWSLRAMIHSGSSSIVSTTHPAWEERLLSMIFKLGDLDLPHTNYGITPEIEDERMYMSNMAQYYEEMYTDNLAHGNGRAFDWMFKYLMAPPKVTAAHHWDMIRDAVKKASNLDMDRLSFSASFSQKANISVKYLF